MGYIRDLVSGKEKKIRADPLAGDVNETGKSGLASLRAGADRLNSVYSQDPTQVVGSQIAQENRFLRSAADDATNRTRQLIAQRGIGNSSIGLGQEVNTRQNLMDRLSQNSASGISRLRDMQIENGQGQLAAGSALFAPKAAQGPMQMSDTKYRTGGYGELIVAGGKAYASGGK